jgi:hypothetical protein
VFSRGRSRAAGHHPLQIGIDVVQFAVTVLDKDRHPVTGLTASDFDVEVR